MRKDRTIHIQPNFRPHPAHLVWKDGRSPRGMIRAGNVSIYSYVWWMLLIWAPPQPPHHNVSLCAFSPSQRPRRDLFPPFPCFQALGGKGGRKLLCKGSKGKAARRELLEKTKIPAENRPMGRRCWISGRCVLAGIFLSALGTGSGTPG